MNPIKLFFLRNTKTIEILHPIEEVKNHLEKAIHVTSRTFKQNIIGNFFNDNEFKADSYFPSVFSFPLERSKADLKGSLSSKNENSTSVEIKIRLHPIYGLFFIIFLLISIVLLLDPQYLIGGIALMILGIAQIPHAIYLRKKVLSDFKNVFEDIK